MIEIIVGKNESGQRLDRILDKIFVNANSGFIFKMLRKKNITLDDKKAQGSERLSPGSSIKLWFSDETFEKLSGKNNKSSKEKKRNPSGGFDFKSRVIYEDDNTLIINKPSGLLSQRASLKDISVNDYLLNYLDFDTDKPSTFKPSICNRLDRNTSGILICGKSLEGLRVNNELIKTKGVSKYYLTLVKGIIDRECVISGFLSKDTRTNKVQIGANPDKGSPIETEYFPLENFNGNTLLSVKLITGKSHQIRAHLSSINHPIIGDYKYGDKEINFKFKEKYGISSQLLHSYKLVYPKETNTAMDGTETFINLRGREFVAKYNEDFRKVIGDGYLENKRP